MAEPVVTLYEVPGHVRPMGAGSNVPQSRGGAPASIQIGYMGEIDPEAEVFALSGHKPFNIKNETGDSVTLEVRLACMSDFIETSFEPGWNPEIVSEVKPNGTEGLKFGL